ncbi:hypothetical protein [Desulfovibrio inopinatus]|uniref:hypothetical protein n=1 Tax=Desulfovibrio inopinatus TaxID=102109 RepID=UPI00146FC742|nr:hypothetical protein [Desulfovibrio inopinatus]
MLTPFFDHGGLSPVLNMPPTSSSGLPYQFEESSVAASNVLGLGVKKSLVSTVSGQPGIVRAFSLTWRARVRSMRDRLFQFFLDCRGAWDGFWIPTWTWHVMPTAPIGAQDAFILGSRGAGYSDYFTGTEYLFLKRRNGDEMIRQVMGADSLGDGEKIYLNAPYGMDIEPDDVVMCCKVLRVRFTGEMTETVISDRDYVHDISAAVVELPNENEATLTWELPNDAWDAWSLGDAGQVLGYPHPDVDVPFFLPLNAGQFSTLATGPGGQSHWFLSAYGRLFGLGDNSQGQLGVPGDFGTVGPVDTVNRYTKIVRGAACGFALRTDGTLWACGLNDHGQLGVGDTVNRSVLTQVLGLWQHVYTQRGYIVLGVKTDGSLWWWGGDTSTATPTLLDDGNWLSAVCLEEPGYGDPPTVLAIHADGSLWGRGWNHFGILATGDTVDRSTMTLADNGPWRWLATDGFYAVCGARSDGSLWAWGVNYYGMLPFGTYASQKVTLPTRVEGRQDWMVLSMRSSVALGLHQDGSCSVWGENGRLGLANLFNVNAPTPVVRSGARAVAACEQALFCLAEGLTIPHFNVFFCDSGMSGYDRLPLLSDTALTTIESGGYRVVGLDEEGYLWSWGYVYQSHVEYRYEIASGNTIYLPKRYPVIFKVISVSSSGVLYGVTLDGGLWHADVHDDGTLDMTQLGEPEDTWSWVKTGTWGGALAIKESDGSLWHFPIDEDPVLLEGTRTWREAVMFTQYKTPYVVAIDTFGIMWHKGFDFLSGQGPDLATHGDFVIANAATWTSLESTYDSILGTNSNGQVLARGWNSDRLLGGGDRDIFWNTFRPIPGLTGCVRLKIRYYAALAFDMYGKLWIWGRGITTKGLKDGDALCPYPYALVSSGVLDATNSSTSTLFLGESQ